MKTATLSEIVEHGTSSRAWHETLEVLFSLAKIDWYVSDLLTQRRSEGEASLYTMLLSVAQNIRDSARYLEIGVRKGFSLAIFAHECPTAHITGIDLWEDEYAGQDNPGPAFVRKQLATAGHRGTSSLLEGDSHKILPNLSGLAFDCITVDGDHTEEGALSDLKWALTHVAPGGFILFDDISNPAHLYLNEMWREHLGEHADFDEWHYDETPNGIAIAQRQRHDD